MVGLLMIGKDGTGMGMQLDGFDDGISTECIYECVVL